MKQICQKECLNENVCDIIDCCIYRHPLVNDTNIWLFTMHGKPTDKYCLINFEILQPFKVSDKDIERWKKNKIKERLKPERIALQQEREANKRKNKKLKVEEITLPHWSGVKYFSPNKSKRAILDILPDHKNYPLFGHLKESIGSYFPIGTQVFQKYEELIVIKGALKLTYPRDIIEHKITKLGHEKKPKDNVPKKIKSNYFSEVYTKEEQKNFHYD